MARTSVYKANKNMKTRHITLTLLAAALMAACSKENAMTYETEKV